MPKVARIGDRWTGICCCHPPAPCINTGGTIVAGNATHESGGSSVARLGDLVIGDCGHQARIVSGAPTHESGGPQVAAIGDLVASGCIIIGMIITGSPTHDSS